MANYNLYDDIDESKLLSLTEILTRDISKNQSALTEFSDSLSEDMLKASEIEALKSGYTKIDEIYTELSSEVETVQKACSYIADYKEARTNALDYENQIKIKETAKDDKENINDMVGIKALNGLKAACERTMEECETKVKEICGV